MKEELKIFTIIVGDLVGSRNVSGRQPLSHKIRLVIDHITKEFRKEFYAPLALTRGIDELSGVLKRPNMSYRICRHLNEGVYPHLFRFAVVRGTLDIAITSKDARRMDGPAFHTGADMIQRAKKKNLYYCFNLGFQFEEFNLWLTELANLLHILRSGWTKHQRRVVQFYERFGNQKAVAKELGITQQAVSDSLRQAHWKELKRVETIIDGVLERNGSNK
ncbi:MAG: hypothetical protein KAW02_06780 [candidate division Zixibacteria bacterium]|nr:hypothetical protein [candidate division Zixibacteria bacterium]